MKDLPVRYQPNEEGYISKKAFDFAIAWLDGQGLMTKIVKAKRVKLYNIFATTESGYSNVANRASRQSAKRYIYHKLFIPKFNS